MRASSVFGSLALGMAMSLSLLVPASGSAAAGGSPLVDRGVLFGAHVDGVPWSGMGPVDELERSLGSRLDVVHVFQAWGNEWGVFRTDWLDAASAGDRAVLLTWEPWDVQRGVTQPEFRPRRIAEGAHDRYIDEWARGLADYGKPVYLRVMHEMNGDWYPWSGGVNDTTPADFIAAWRHIHDRFQRAGADNVMFVWCPLVDDVPATNTFERYWPGSRYVDVLALDGYNWGADLPEHGGWRSVDEVFSVAYDRLEALADKPIWIAEVGSDDVGGDKAAWVADLLTTTRYPRLEAVVWFHVDKERDWRLTSPPAVATTAGRLLNRSGTTETSSIVIERER